MKKSFIIFNVIIYLAIGGYLGVIVYNSLAAHHPWSMACYNCKKCDSVCVLGIDPQGFITAAYSGEPDLYIRANNIKLTVERAMNIDPDMRISLDGKDHVLHEALENGLVSISTEIITSSLRASDAARLCLGCGACERACPLKLPISRIIKDLSEYRKASPCKD